MKKVLFALPLVALMLAVACKKQEAAPATTEQPGTEKMTGTVPAAAPAPAVEAAPAPATPAKPAVKKGK